MIHITKNVVSALIAVIMSTLLLLLGRGVVGELFGINENFYLKYYYDIVNGKDADGRVFTVPDSLTIINLQNYRNRYDIARILEKVYDYNPRVIGLDVFFNSNPDIQEDVNLELINVLRKVQDKIVIPCNYSTDEKGVISTVYPFFYNEEGLEELVYASPVSHDFYGYYKYDDSSIKNKDTLSPVLPRMSYAIAQTAGKTLQDYSRNFYINYSKKDLSQIIQNDTSDIRPSVIQDRVVLIGDMSEIKDMTRLPFRFGRKKEISGIEDIAYSFICLTENKRFTAGENMRFRGFTDWPIGVNVILSFILAFVFSFFHRRYKRGIVISLRNKKSNAFVLTLFQPLLFLLAEALTIVVCFFITFYTNALPDLFLSMITIGCVSVSVDLSEILIHES